jgi:hypothetical protein
MTRRTGNNYSGPRWAFSPYQDREPGFVPDPDAGVDSVSSMGGSGQTTTRYTRKSIPTQLREAGHTVTTTFTPEARYTYVVDGEFMGLKEAADRFLPGGWAESFDRVIQS